MENRSFTSEEEATGQGRLNQALPKPENVIRIRGARTHNLQNLTLEIPRDKLVVITGVSGSGKSSLAFDTLFAEGRRRYLDSLSSQTRQALSQGERPDVDDISGLPPTLAVDQRLGRVSPRSTLATLTEIYDHLRVLFARAGTPHCPDCRREISTQPLEAIVDGILGLEPGRKVMLLAPLIRGRKGIHRDVFEKICRVGFVRARVDGDIVDAAAPPDLAKGKLHTIEVVVDRISVKEGLRSRLLDSVALALRHGEGCCIVSSQEGTAWRDRLFSTRSACLECGLSFPPIEPRTFSFNSPYGACPCCEGLGVVREPFNKLAKPRESTSGKRHGKNTGGRGSRRAENLPSDSDEAMVAVNVVCPDCDGSRLSPVGRAVSFLKSTLPEIVAQTVDAARATLDRWQAELVTLEAPQREVARRILPEVGHRLRFLGEVGLDYLTLNRTAETLSGGELQRARLGRCLGGGLLGVCYILDEPTMGLHPQDTLRLLSALCHLREQGNSVLVVEHDVDVMQAADWLIDIGPGAGTDGGRLVAVGLTSDVACCPNSLTGAALLARASPWRMLPASAPIVLEKNLTPDCALIIEGVRTQNLKNVRACFPHRALTCVTGVSGSGKTSLVLESLVPIVRHELDLREQRLHSAPAKKGVPGPAEATFGVQGRLLGFEPFARLVQVDQSPLGCSGRSNPATASGIWDHLRKLFARTKDARLRGFTASRFSFNNAGGRCEVCRGTGSKRLAAGALPDLEVPCTACRGARFNRQTLQVRFHGLTVADVLNLRIEDALVVFENLSVVRAILETFVRVGLGYLKLGQPATTLSGGEAQRVKLTAELSRTSIEPAVTLYVLDEPTSGLHPADVARLLGLLRELTTQGHTVVVVEHHLDVIASADWVIDLGPTGGDRGGHLVGQGPPAAIAAIPASATGQFLRPLIDGAIAL